MVTGLKRQVNCCHSETFNNNGSFVEAPEPFFPPYPFQVFTAQSVVKKLMWKVSNLPSGIWLPTFAIVESTSWGHGWNNWNLLTEFSSFSPHHRSFQRPRCRNLGMEAEADFWGGKWYSKLIRQLKTNLSPIPPLTWCLVPKRQDQAGSSLESWTSIYSNNKFWRSFINLQSKVHPTPHEFTSCRICNGAAANILPTLSPRLWKMLPKHDLRDPSATGKMDLSLSWWIFFVTKKTQGAQRITNGY